MSAFDPKLTLAGGYKRQQEHGLFLSHAQEATGTDRKSAMSLLGR
jgi:hypothetical protein